MQIYARYDLPIESYAKNEDGVHLTRRQHYALMGDAVTQPDELHIPDDGLYLWRLFADADNALSRMRDGVCQLIPPSEWLAWSVLTARDLSFEEYEILHALDVIFCTEINKELASQRNKQSEDITRQRR